jgi:hypothetical protein
MRPSLLLALACLMVVVAGCAPTAAPPARATSAPRTRCLSDPYERDTRPLFFLFCIEAP